VKRDSTPWIPYQKRSGWWGSRWAGLEVVALVTTPMEPARTARVLEAKRRDEAVKRGTLASAARRKI